MYKEKILKKYNIKINHYYKCLIDFMKLNKK